jgi:hypothetical protein
MSPTVYYLNVAHNSLFPQINITETTVREPPSVFFFSEESKGTVFLFFFLPPPPPGHSLLLCSSRLFARAAPRPVRARMEDAYEEHLIASTAKARRASRGAARGNNGRDDPAQALLEECVRAFLANPREQERVLDAVRREGRLEQAIALPRVLSACEAKRVRAYLRARPYSMSVCAAEFGRAAARRWRRCTFLLRGGVDVYCYIRYEPRRPFWASVFQFIGCVCFLSDAA